VFPSLGGVLTASDSLRNQLHELSKGVHAPWSIVPRKELLVFSNQEDKKLSIRMVLNHFSVTW
jgi:hypothetical protein